MSHPHLLSSRDTRDGLIAMLGADFQSAVSPFKDEIKAIARLLGGDVHRAAMRLLVERNGRRPTTMEQQLIVAALAELQNAAPLSGDILGRVAVRLNEICDTLPRPPEAGTPRRAVLRPAPEGGCAAGGPGP